MNKQRATIFTVLSILGVGGWMGLTYILYSQDSLILALLMLTLGPIVLSLILALSYGIIKRGQALLQGSIIGFGVAAISQIYAFQLRAQTDIMNSLDEISNELSQGNDQVVIEVSTDPQIGEFLFGFFVILAAGSFGGWITKFFFKNKKSKTLNSN